MNFDTPQSCKPQESHTWIANTVNFDTPEPYIPPSSQYSRTHVITPGSYKHLLSQSWIATNIISIYLIHTNKNKAEPIEITTTFQLRCIGWVTIGW